ncbi:MAG: PP2C family protein-serine/threonine phosphatase [Pseudonocardiaceae bacterium]
MSDSEVTWTDVLTQIIDESHLVTGDQLSAMVDRAVCPLGLTVEVLVVDLAQRMLSPVRPQRGMTVDVEGTLAGRAYQLGEIFSATDGADGRLLWVPILDGTDRAGVMRIGLAPGVIDDMALRRRCWTLSGLLGHVLISKIPYSERLKWIRSHSPLSPSAELLWQLLPPRTFATDHLVLTALLEPYDQVAGDAYDYAVDTSNAYLAVFDGVGHDLQAGQTTAVAITAIRHARQKGVTDLATLAARADDLLTAQPGGTKFVTAVLATLNTDTGMLQYLLAGHPAPLLVRHGRAVKELASPPRLPLGLRGSPPDRLTVHRERLEPGDRLLLYSDGITEARDAQGKFFGEQRLVDFIERAELDRLPAPETLRRLTNAVLAHQGGLLQDDATLIMVDWSADAHLRLFPALR